MTQLTVAQVETQRRQLASRLATARGEHVRLAYLAATEDGHDEASRLAKSEVDNLEAALQHVSTIHVGALEAAERAEAIALQQRRDEFIAEADDAAGKTMVLADNIDTAIAALASAWADFEQQWDAHSSAVLSLSRSLPETRIQAIVDASSRSQSMRELISTLLYRGGLSLPDGDNTLPISESRPFVEGVEHRIVHLRRVSNQLSGDFPGRGKYVTSATSANAA